MIMKRNVGVRILKIFLNLFFPLLAVLGTYKSKVKGAWKKFRTIFNQSLVIKIYFLVN
jgi:hypothetical protein